MNVQPKLSHDEDPMPKSLQPALAYARRQPGGPRGFSTRLEAEETWPIEFEVEPWRP